MTENSARHDGASISASSFTLMFLPLGDQRYQVRFERPDGGITSESLYYGYTQKIDAIMLLLRTTLEKIREKLTLTLNLNIELNRAVAVLKEIYELGRSIWIQLLGKDGLRDLWVYTGRYRNNGNTNKTLRIEFIAPPHWIIPIEILPLGPQNTTELRPDDLEAVKTFVRLLPAFSAEIRYLLWPAKMSPAEAGDKSLRKNLLPSNMPIPIRPFIPLLFLWYEGGPQASEARQYIWSLDNTIIKPDGAFPNKTQFNTKESLSRLLMEQGTSLAREQGGTPVPIVHIHSHGDIPAIADIDKIHLGNIYQLIFGYYKNTDYLSKIIQKALLPEPENFEVSHGDLLKAIDINASLDEAGPFVFVNACGGVAPTYMGGLDLPSIFLENGYRAVIGSRVSIPGLVAEYIARQFYSYLLKEHTLSECLLLSRNDLFNNYHNPSGVFYTIYGQSLLRIDRQQ